MSATSFKIYFSDSTVPKKRTIVISPATVDATSTSLMLHGPGSSNYAENMWSNMVHIMENFCSPIKPRNPTEGQLWYNPVEKTIKIYSTSASDYEWYDLFVNNPTSKSPKMELDPESLKLLNDKLSLSGGTMTGILILAPEEYNEDGTLVATSEDNANAAVTRKYVDTSIQTALKALGNLQNGTSSNSGGGNGINDQTFAIIGNLAIVEGVIGGGTLVNQRPVKYTSGTTYGNIYDVHVEFPDQVKPYSLDANSLPNYSVSATCSLKHPDSTYNTHLKNYMATYPAKAINLTENGFTLQTTVGLIFDDDAINSLIDVYSFKYSVIGRKQ